MKIFPRVSILTFLSYWEVNKLQTNGVEEASVHFPSHSQTWAVMTLTYM